MLLILSASLTNELHDQYVVHYCPSSANSKNDNQPKQEEKHAHTSDYEKPAGITKQNVITDLQRLSFGGMAKEIVLLKQSENCTQVTFSSGVDFCHRSTYFIISILLQFH